MNDKIYYTIYKVTDVAGGEEYLTGWNQINVYDNNVNKITTMEEVSTDNIEQKIKMYLESIGIKLNDDVTFKIL